MGLLSGKFTTQQVHKITSAALLALGMLVGSAAQALPVSTGFDGQRIGIQYFYPNLATLDTDLGAVVVGAGVEFNDGQGNTADFTNTRVTAHFANTSNYCGQSSLFCPQPGTTFNGVRLYDIDHNINAITGVVLGAGSTMSFFASRLTFNADEVFLNLEGLTIPANTTLVFDFTFAPSAVANPNEVPLPATAWLVGAALAGLGLSRRARR